ncbi:MAG: DUF7537 family lipoprotein [Halobacteriota archaeon]|uniref:DUF7537 family lipoprotein n=1 Tax=Natronomonas sp. TaxID=2184060 RepID=UPI003975B95E
MILLVVLAGCSGLGVDTGNPTSESAETVTPVPVPEADPATLRSSGIDDDGISDPGALARAHNQWLADRSYTFVSNQTIRHENGTVLSQYTVQLRLAENRTYHATVRTGGIDGPKLMGEPPAYAEFWSDRETYLRAFGENEPQYNEFSPTSSGVGTWYFWAGSGAFDSRMNAGVMIESSFDAIPTRIDERRTEAGVPQYRLSGTESEASNLSFSDADPASDVALTAEVDGTGLVRHLQLEYRGQLDGEPVVVTRRISYSDVGNTDVGRPDWFDEATRTT